MSTPNALSYNAYVSQIGTMAVVNTGTITNVSGNPIVIGEDAPAPYSPTSPFNLLIPQMLNYAELRIQRDLDLLSSLTYSSAYSIASGANIVSIPTGSYLSIQTIGVVSGTATTQLIPTTKEFIYNVYGDSSVTGQPVYFAMIGGDVPTGGLTSNKVLFGPYSDAAYTLSVSGTYRLPSLYPAVGTDGYPTIGTGATFISTWLPDLLVMASMIYLSAYQRNFGGAGNDPQMPGTYETQYQMLLKGATVEEARKKFNSSGWTPLSPATVATPSR